MFQCVLPIMYLWFYILSFVVLLSDIFFSSHADSCMSIMHLCPQLAWFLCMFVFALFLIVTTFLCCLAAPSLIIPPAFPFKVYRSCCCGRIMARPPNNIKSINGSKEALKLVVRITDLWFVGTFNRSEQAEMVITDSHVWFSLSFCLVHY